MSQRRPSEQLTARRNPAVKFVVKSSVLISPRSRHTKLSLMSCTTIHFAFAVVNSALGPFLCVTRGDGTKNSESRGNLPDQGNLFLVSKLPDNCKRNHVAMGKLISLRRADTVPTWSSLR